MTAILFVALAAAVAAGLVASLARYLPRPAAWRMAAGLAAWLGWVCVASGFGLTRTLPGGPALVLLPAFGLALVLAGSAGGRLLAAALPPALLIGAQAYRLGVELLLHRLWAEGLVPRMLTFEGANPDILVAATAPLAAWAATRGRTGAWLALGWNLLGLAAVTNVVTRAVLTAPGPLNLLPAEVPNLAAGLFPYALLPGFLAPLAVALHLVAIRALLARIGGLRTGGVPA